MIVFASSISSCIFTLELSTSPMSCRFSIDEYISSAVTLSRFSVSGFVVISRGLSTYSRFESPFETQLVPECRTTFNTLVMSAGRIVDGIELR